MAMKEYSTFPKAPQLKPYYQMSFSIISRIFIGEGLTPLQRWSLRILQSKKTGLMEDLRHGMVSGAIQHQVFWGKNPICQETQALLHTSAYRGRAKKRVCERERESLTLPRSFICYFSHATLRSLEVLFRRQGMYFFSILTIIVNLAFMLKLWFVWQKFYQTGS